MNITLTVQTETAGELATAIRSLAGALPALEITSSTDVPGNIFDKKMSGAEKKPTRQKDEKPAAATPAAAKANEISIETVREAAMKVKAIHGLDKVTEILETMGKSRVVDLEPEQYASFLEKLPAV